jgi:hypothetical protein
MSLKRWGIAPKGVSASEKGSALKLHEFTISFTVANLLDLGLFYGFHVFLDTFLAVQYTLPAMLLKQFLSYCLFLSTTFYTLNSA